MKKTEQKAKLETRKHKAIRRMLICLAVLVAFSTLHLYTFTPMQGVRYVEAQNRTGRTHVVTRMLPPRELHLWGTLFYLTANENAVLMSYVQFHPLVGWMNSLGAALDCSDSAPIHAGRCTMGHDDGSAWYIFGRVDDLNIKQLVVSMESLSYDDSGAEVRTELFRTAAEATEWTERGDERYYIVPLDDSGWTDRDGGVTIFTACGLNAGGKEIATQRADQQGASIMIG